MGIKSIKINRVGVTAIDFPLVIFDKNGDQQTVSSKVNLYGSLPSGWNGKLLIEGLFPQNNEAYPIQNLHRI